MDSRIARLGAAACAAALATFILAHENHTGAQAPFFGGGVAGDFSPPISFEASNVQLLSWIPVTQFNASFTSASVVEHYVSPSGRKYALVGLSGGTGVVEVTDPSNARIVTGPGFDGVVTGPTSLWRDIRTYGQFAYAVSEGGGGIQVMSLAQIDAGVVTLVTSVNDVGPSATHTLFINQASGFLYRCGGGGGAIQGLRIYSLANPAAPQHVASWGTSARYVHECQVVNYTSGPYAGREIAFCFSNNTGGGGNAGVDIVDVTNKASLVDLSRASYSNPDFSHQGWLSDDKRYVYLNDELDNLPVTRIINVENLSAPFEAGTFAQTTTAIDHNLYCLGNLIFEANYRSGLRIFDATNPLAPVEVGYFDTYVEDDIPAFNALWDNDPYLGDGIVLGSDIEKGLFVWKLGPPEIAISFPDGVPTGLSPIGGSFRVRVQAVNGGALEPGTPTLHYNTGSGFVTAALTPLGGNLYSAAYPALPCGELVGFFVTAESTTGVVVREPMTAPIAFYSAVAAFGSEQVFEDTIEADAGWIVGAPGDDATTGLWVRVDPIGTAAQPEDDHTPAPGVLCWVTGQGTVGGGVGEADVDGGRTTLTSPILNAAGLDRPVISYWRWFSNNSGAAAGSDVFTIDVSNNNGASWTNVEVVGPTGLGTMGGWFYHEFEVSALLPPTSQMRLRFIAADLGNGSVIEAAIDDVQIRDLICVAPTGDVNCDGAVDFFDIDPFLLALFDPAAYAALYPGCNNGDVNGDGGVDFFDIDPFLTCLFSGCP